MIDGQPGLTTGSARPSRIPLKYQIDPARNAPRTIKDIAAVAISIFQFTIIETRSVAGHVFDPPTVAGDKQPLWKYGRAPGTTNCQEGGHYVDAIDAALAQARNLLGSGAAPITTPASAPAPIAAPQTWSGDAHEAAMTTSATLDGYRTDLHTVRSGVEQIVAQSQLISRDALLAMDGVQSQWQSDKAALQPWAGTPEGQAALLSAGQQRLTEATDIVKAANDQFSTAATQVQNLTGQLPKPGQQNIVQSVDFKQAPPDKPPVDKDGEAGEEDKKHGGSVSKGKGSSTHIEQHGEVEQEWGHPTGDHELFPDVPGKTGTFDDGKGSWEWQGPGSHGEAYGSQTTDGMGGKANADAWLVKGEGQWQTDVFGNPLTATGSGEVGAHGDSGLTVTDHGISGGVDAFAGAEIGSKVDYQLGPVDLSLGATGQAGAGGAANIDFGMEDGKFVIGGELGLAWGLGGKIAPHIAVDPQSVVNGVTKAGEWVADLFN